MAGAATDASDEGPAATARLPRLVAQVGTSGRADRVALSADGRFVVTGGFDGVRLWDAASGAELRTLTDHYASSLALSPDSRHVAVANGCCVSVIDLATGEATSSSPGSQSLISLRLDTIFAVAYAPDGRTLLTGSGDGTARLWDAGSGTEIRRFAGHTDQVFSVDFSRDGRTVVTGSRDATVRLWDVASGAETARFEGSTHHVLSAALSPNGESVIGGCRDGTARIWDVGTGAVRHVLAQPSDWDLGEVSRVAFSPDGRTVMTSRARVAFWDAATGARRPIDHVWGPVAFSFDWRMAVCHDAEGARLVEVETGRLVQIFKGYAEWVWTVMWAPDGRTLLTSNGLLGACLWDLDTGTARLVASGSDDVAAAVFSPDGRRLLLVGRQSIRLLEAETEVVVGRLDLDRSNPSPFSGNRLSSSNVAFSRDGRFVAVTVVEPWTSGDDRERLAGAALWDVATGSVRYFVGHEGSTASVAISPDGRRVVTGGFDRFARLWDVDSGRELGRFGPGLGHVNSVAFSADGRYVLAATGDATPIMWDTATGAEVARFEMDPACSPCIVMNARYAPDGRQVVATGNPIQVWDAETGRFVRRGSTGDPFGAPSPDERLAASMDGCFTVLRDLASGRTLCRLTVLEDGSWVVIDPDGRFDTNNLDGIRGLHWIAPDDPFTPLPIEVFMRDFYEPRLLPRLLAGEALAPVRDLLSLDRAQPLVRIVDVTPSPDAPSTVDVRVDVAARPPIVRASSGRARSGVYDVRLFRDGRLVGYAPESDGPITLDAVDNTATLVFHRIRLPRRAGRPEVAFSAYAFNADGVKSATDRRSYALESSAGAAKGRAYVVSVGINSYGDPSLDLRFAVNDASRLSAALSDAIARTGDYEEVVAVPLLADGSPGSAATKSDIADVLALLAGRPVAPERARRIPNADRIRHARPDDLVVLTFSSHGYADGRGNFYLVPADVGPNARESISAAGDAARGAPPDGVLARCISTDELSRWLRDVDAGDMVLIIDACQSASFTGRNFKPGPMGSRGLGQLAFDKGMRVLAATQADNVALEVAQLERGLATYTLVDEGLAAAQADFEPRDRAIMLGEWLRYAVDRVPKLHAEIASGQLRVFGAVRPRIVVRKAAGTSGRDVVHEPAARTLQRPALFDFSGDTRDVLLVRTGEQLRE